MTPDTFDSHVMRRALAGAVSAALHVVMFLAVVYSGGRNDGVGENDTLLTQLVLLEAPEADRRDGVDLTPIAPAAVVSEMVQRLRAEAPPRLAAVDEVTAETTEPQLDSPAEPSVAVDVDGTAGAHVAATYVMPAAEKSALAERLARLAEEFADQRQAQATWEQDGAQYSALLIQERANDGTALDRVVAEVTASDRGRQWTTRVLLKRLAFSQFTQMVDRWDPKVQLHDDVIVGRFHSNSRFNVLYDRGATPKFVGKVTTAARSYDVKASGRRRDAQIFQGGVETGVDHIDLPMGLQPSEWAPPEANARIHELAGDTRIRFFSDGSYTWRTKGEAEPGYVNGRSEHPVYFIGASGATLYVKGVVAGDVLIYSPHKIVIEGSLKYAEDPREVPDSGDYVGLVCDKYIEVAGPSVTGPGDLDIHGAIFAGRRFVVRNIEHRRSATLRIFGSLAAGSLSASEPRYSTELEYDQRFEERRPPGFPSTDRYEADVWDGQWVETSAPFADEAL